MQEKNNQTTVKILIGVIIGLSVFILLGGIFYIFNMQNKIAKLEIEQEKQLKRQVETQKMASIHQLNTKMRPVENELNSYTYENTRYCAEFLGYREKLHQKWDDELTKIYKLLMSKYSDSQKKSLKSEEIAWIKKRQKAIDKISSEMNGCLGGVVIENTEIDTIKSRAIELARRYDGL